MLARATSQVAGPMRQLGVEKNRSANEGEVSQLTIKMSKENFTRRRFGLRKTLQRLILWQNAVCRFRARPQLERPSRY